MYGKPFNEKRDFGTVLGDSRFYYDQEGQLYNAMKQPVDSNGNIMQLAPKATATATETEATEPPPATEPDDDIPEDEKEFPLLAWALGDETLKATPWPKVKAEAARVLDDMTGITSKELARKAILDHFKSA